MKKCLSMLLALLLVLPLAAFAEDSVTEEDQRGQDLLEVWDYNGESPSWVCSAIPVADSAVMVSPAALPENVEHLVVTDGVSLWEAEAVMPDPSGLIALLLYDGEETKPRYQSWNLLSLGQGVDAASCVARFGDMYGSRINRGVLDAEKIAWDDQPCYVLTLSDDAPLGSPVLDNRGILVATIVAGYAEGQHRYLALPADGIANAVTQISLALEEISDTTAPEGLKVTANKNLVTVDWEEMTFPELQEGETLYLVIHDVKNDYLNYYPAQTYERKQDVILTPGRTYVISVGVYTAIPDTVAEQYVTITIPAAKRVTEHNFTPVRTAIAVSENPELAPGESPKPIAPEEVTTELLRSGCAWFYSVSTYEVDDVYRDLTLLVTLTDPREKNYRYESTWVFSPEYMEEDTWYISLRANQLTDGLDAGGYPAGVYEMAFYIDGDLADSFSFELK